RDAGNPKQALENYRRRTEMGGWEEEVWYSYFQIAELQRKLDADEEMVVGAYLRAYAERPTRAEPLVCLARYLREKKRWASAKLFAAQAMAISKPNDLLFLWNEAYSWRALDEYSVATYWLDEVGISADACRKLLLNEDVPDRDRGRIVRNLKFAMRGLVKNLDLSEESPLPPANQLKNQTLPAIAVIGPWRGGTSLVTDILEKLGVDVGGPFFDAGTDYCTFEDESLRNGCLKCFDETEMNWGPIGTIEDRAEILGRWIIRQRHHSKSKFAVGGKHPIMCQLVDELHASWGRSGPVKLVSVVRSVEDIKKSWDRADRDDKLWWPRNDRDRILREMIDARDQAIKKHDHLCIEFDTLRESPLKSIQKIAEYCGLPAERVETAANSVRR
ncbi:MAG: hypothetical protein AAFU85_15200, partial [Planctomycetota bacterium]